MGLGWSPTATVRDMQGVDEQGLLLRTHAIERLSLQLHKEQLQWLQTLSSALLLQQVGGWHDSPWIKYGCRGLC